jgi:iron complex transport system substrate-binding protein
MHFRNKHWLNYSLLLLLLVTVVLVGCTTQAAHGNVVDDLGRTVSLQGDPQRIISLAPSSTEILYALGLGDRIVGVTDFCDYPPEAADKPKVGGFSTVNIEQVIALEPDLVLAAQIHSKTVIPALEELGVTVVALSPLTLDDVLDNITLIGRTTGKDTQAHKLVKDLERRIEAVTKKTQAESGAEQPEVLYVTWHDPLMTAGSETLADDVITTAGGHNLASDILGHKTIDLETVIHRNPDVIIATVGMGSGEDLPWQYILNETRLKDCEARLHNRVYKIDGDVVHRSGPRIIDGLEQMARFIHPERFE